MVLERLTGNDGTDFNEQHNKTALDKLNAAIDLINESGLDPNDFTNIETDITALEAKDVLHEGRLDTLEAAPAGVQITTANLELFVDFSAGDDGNDGLTGNPVKTMAAVLALIPTIVNHDVTVWVETGVVSN